MFERTISNLTGEPLNELLQVTSLDEELDILLDEKFDIKRAFQNRRVISNVKTKFQNEYVKDFETQCNSIINKHKKELLKIGDTLNTENVSLEDKKNFIIKELPKTITHILNEISELEGKILNFIKDELDSYNISSTQIKIVQTQILIIIEGMINCIFGSVLNTLFPKNDLGSKVMATAIAPINEEIAKLTAEKYIGNFGKNGKGISVHNLFFNIFEMSEYVFTAALSGGIEIIPAAILVRIPAVIMHSINTVILKIFDKNKKVEADNYGILITITIHTIWNALASFTKMSYHMTKGAVKITGANVVVTEEYIESLDAEIDTLLEDGFLSDSSSETKIPFYYREIQNHKAGIKNYLQSFEEEHKDCEFNINEIYSSVHDTRNMVSRKISGGKGKFVKIGHFGLIVSLNSNSTVSSVSVMAKKKSSEDEENSGFTDFLITEKIRSIVTSKNEDTNTLDEDIDSLLEELDIFNEGLFDKNEKKKIYLNDISVCKKEILEFLKQKEKEESKIDLNEYVDYSYDFKVSLNKKGDDITQRSLFKTRKGKVVKIEYFTLTVIFNDDTSIRNVYVLAREKEVSSTLPNGKKIITKCEGHIESIEITWKIKSIIREYKKNNND